ncbi:MAG: hypothetical protein ACI80R_000479 [Aquiluna sp.]|jgi:hypothetical protein|tara:strand:+ start:672 stop:1226 length:555 start_codon:yes stop_codon:yes gene_type:complete
MNLDSVSAETKALIASAANRLLAAGANPEQLALSTPASRLLGILPRSASYKKAGEGFLLGALVVTTHGDVFEPGLIIRASLKVFPGHQAQSAQERLELRRKLLAAKFPEDSAVLIDPRRLPIDDLDQLAKENGPLVLREIVVDGIRTQQLLVRWMSTASDSDLRPLKDYLNERVELAVTGIAEA